MFGFVVFDATEYSQGRGLFGSPVRTCQVRGNNSALRRYVCGQKWKATVIPYSLAFEKFLLVAPKKILTFTLAYCSHRLATCGNL